jgi:exosortase/archaeosortase family protein
MIAMSVRREVTLTAVQFLAVASTIAIVLYYLPNYYMYKEVVAQNSQTLMQAIGINGVTWSQGGKVFLNEFEIQRMCTGVQVIAVFLGIVVAVPKVDLKRRVMALSVVAVSVHFANVGRIALEIWLLYSGILPWSLAHYPTGLILGVFSVAFLILAADVFIPEIGDLAFSVVDAYRRP